jgi:superfamily I DNA/RNA helicase
VRYDLRKSVHLSVAEERRVLYVAMTRARNRLILTYRDTVPAKAITKKFNKPFRDIRMKPSRFLEELPSSINHVTV